MQALDDNVLLRDYAEQRSEEAFATLVSRHINKVYSVAWRHTGNTHQAEEVTQSVFVLLAQNAHRLTRHTLLSGWLYRTAHLSSLTYIRGEIRRNRRHEEAHMQTALNNNEPDAWPQMAPFLDAAMERLKQKERDAIVLRFFDGKSMKEVGASLGVGEDAAKKRVTRALEKLQMYFVRHGVSSTTAVLAGTISSNCVQMAPLGLAKAVTASAVAKGAAVSVSSLTIGALKIMAWTKAKTAIAVSAAVLLTAGTVTTVVIYHHRSSSLFTSTKELSTSENARYASLTGSTPEEAARSFFTACANNDWTEASKYFPPGITKKFPSFLSDFTNSYGGMEIVSMGKPFKGRISITSLPAQARQKIKAEGITRDFEYPGIYVPYEIRLASGDTKKWQLAIRCDNREHHWYWDGGM